MVRKSLDTMLAEVLADEALLDAHPTVHVLAAILRRGIERMRWLADRSEGAAKRECLKVMALAREQDQRVPTAVRSVDAGD